jgi:hypothetical protein
MSKELSRTFDLQHGAVMVNVQDSFGNVSAHTLYLNGVPDVNAAIAQILTDTDAAATLLRNRMIAAGWTP